jgi:diaminobutyrate-2-oxoglutarate transaminase
MAEPACEGSASEGALGGRATGVSARGRTAGAASGSARTAHEGTPRRQSTRESAAQTYGASAEFGEAAGGEGLAVTTDAAAHDEIGPAAPALAPASVHPHPPAPGIAAAVQRECLRRGLIVELGGPHANVVRLLPPLTISDEQATVVLDRLADAVQTVARAHAGNPSGPRRPHEARSGPQRRQGRFKRAVLRGS